MANGTNVHMGLGTLESSGQPARSHLVAGEHMVHGVNGARAQQGRPAGARDEVQGTGDARHRANGKPNDKQETRRKVDGIGNGARNNTQIFGARE